MSKISEEIKENLYKKELYSIFLWVKVKRKEP